MVGGIVRRERGTAAAKQATNSPKQVIFFHLYALFRGPPRGPAACHNADALGYNLTPRARPHDAVLPPPAPTAWTVRRRPACRKKGGIRYCGGSSGPYRYFVIPGGSPRCADYRDARGTADGARKRTGIACGRGPNCSDCSGIDPLAGNGLQLFGHSRDADPGMPQLPAIVGRSASPSG